MYNKENLVTQDVIKVGGLVTVVSHVQLHVLEDIVFLVMVAVCGAVIQTTVYIIYVKLPLVNVHKVVK